MNSTHTRKVFLMHLSCQSPIPCNMKLYMITPIVKPQLYDHAIVKLHTGMLLLKFKILILLLKFKILMLLLKYKIQNCL